MASPLTIYTIQLDHTTYSQIAAIAVARGAAVAAFSSADEFTRSRRGEETGCVVLDIAAAEEEKLAWVRDFSSQRAPLPVIVLADNPSVPLAVQAMQLGAVSILAKPPAPEELESAVDSALRREQEQSRVRRRREDLLARLASLTEGEDEVLRRLVAGMANKNIAADLELGLRTVELRRAKILKKMGAKSLAELVRLVMIASPDWLPQEP